MRKLTKIAALTALSLVSLLAGCSNPTPEIVCGREWNPGSQIVADTSSTFDLTDQLIIQFSYGTGFDFNTLKMSFYEGTLKNRGAEIWSHEARVTDKMSSYTLQGRTKHGQYLTARDMTKRKHAGSIVVEVSTGGKVLAAKELQLTTIK